MESSSNNHSRHRDYDGVSDQGIPLEGYGRPHDSQTFGSMFYDRSDTDEYWQGGPFEHHVAASEPAYRDDIHDPSAAMSIHQRKLSGGEGGAQRQFSTSKTQGVNQETYSLVNASDDEGRYPLVTPPGKTPSFLGTWWPEMLSVFLIVGMLAAIVGTIFPYQYKPQPSWPYGVQLNTIVSAYVLILKTFVILVVSTGLGQLKWSWFRRAQPLSDLALYDDASRGVWGSFGLIFFLRRRTLLPYLGALLMILAMILDPFGQQLLSFYSCQIYDPSIKASLPTTSYATVGLGEHYGAGLESLKVSSQSSTNMGIFSNTLQNVTFSCATGNCTYPTNYTTAGWCSSCEDVTGQLQIVKGANFTNAGNNYTLPSTNLTVAVSQGESFRVGVDIDADSNAYGVRLQAIMAMGEVNTSNTPWGIRGYGAAECYLAACAKSLMGSVVLGQLSENVTDSSIFQIAGSGYTSTIYVPCLNDSERETVESMGYQLDGNSTTWLSAYNLSNWADLAYNPSINNATMTTIRPECFYQSFNDDILSLEDYLAGLFEGSLEGFYGIVGSSVLSVLFDEYNITFTSFDATMSRMAQSLSAWGRDNAANTSQTLISGKAYRSDTCVAVGWWWLLYPIVLSVATIVFLVGTAIWTREHASSQVDWKNEVLPLMFCEIERAGKDADGRKEGVLAGAVSDMKGVREQAKGLKVKLDRGVDGWRFVETSYAVSRPVLANRS